MKYLLLPLLLLATPALADRRIEQVYYSPDRIVTITGHKAVQTMIEFGDDERIENIAVGDSAAWQVTPNKRANLVFVKPLMKNARTNMTVVTDRRRYLFDLADGTGRGRSLYTLRFIYPEEPKPLVIERSVTAPPPPPELNFSWSAAGDKRLLPQRVFDDGSDTYLAWSDSAELPAIFTVGADKSEGPVNYTVRDKVLVIDGVAPVYVLRNGKNSATITNLKPRAEMAVDAAPLVAAEVPK